MTARMSAIIGLILLTWGSPPANGSDNYIVIQPELGYHWPRVFTQSQSAGYTGMAYGGSIFYRIGDDDFAIAPVVSYTLGKFDSTANSAVRQETFRERTLGFGLKAYLESFFLRLNYAILKVEDQTTGNLTQTIADSHHGFGGSLGYVISFSRYFKVELSADVQTVSFPAKVRGFISDSQYLRFGGTVGLGFIIPSGPKKKGYFIETDAPVSGRF